LVCRRDRGGERKIDFVILLKVLAFDPDEGDNGLVDYSIKAGRGKGKLKIDPETGIVYASKPLLAGSEYDVSVSVSIVNFTSTLF